MLHKEIYDVIIKNVGIEIKGNIENKTLYKIAFIQVKSFKLILFTKINKNKQKNTSVEYCLNS